MKINKNRFNYSVRVLLRRKGKILLLERSQSRGGFSLPGGNVDLGETPLQAIKRETLEEVGLKIKKKNLRLIHTLQRKRKRKKGFEIIYFYEARDWKGKLEVKEPHKFSAVRWFDESHLPKKLSNILALGIRAIQGGKKVSYVHKSNTLKKLPKARN